MTTKEQERKALAKIRKIVEELGENSYIGMAFDGCFEIAENNIDDDYGCSMKTRAESAEKEADYYKRLAEQSRNQLEPLTKQIADQEDKIAAYRNRLEEERNFRNEAYNKYMEAENEAEDLKDVIEKKEQEIITLKAKLYDLMIAA